jgi:large subunit ribosomal protein L29
MATGTKPAELRELSDPELVERLREAKAELFNLRVQGATGQLDNNRRLQVVRREIARIYTIIRERELGLSAAPAEFAAALQQAEQAGQAEQSGRAGPAEESEPAERTEPAAAPGTSGAEPARAS